MQKGVAKLALKIAGQQGEGVESAGDVMAKALNRLGYCLYGYRHFSSRIKGGHTSYNLRVSLTPVSAVADKFDIIIAFDQESIDKNREHLRAGGVMLADAKINPLLAEDMDARLYKVPFTDIAATNGLPMAKNMAAVGAAAVLLGIHTEVFAAVIADIFAHKAPKIIDDNLKVLQAGKEFLAGTDLPSVAEFSLAVADQAKRMFLIGNDAIALGALAAGAKFMAAYPITPASEIMEYLVQKLPTYGGTVIQTEDEIAACTMAIGANYAGTRAFTATAGPGLSLMSESIGLAGMTETPLVVIDTQRGGPSTGLPTKHEQSDLMAVVYGTHGDVPKIVLAPSTVEEAFFDTIEAFNLAEQYQCPVILLSDLQLSLGKQSVEPFDYERIEIKRGYLQTDPLPQLAKLAYYKRYDITANGISPRVTPGTKNGVHLVTGLEHDQCGKPTESPSQRKAQMDKRLQKLQRLVKEYPVPVYSRSLVAPVQVLLIGIGSTRGAIGEIIPKLEQDGVTVNHAHIRLVHPFPADELALLVKQAQKIIVIENNASGQLANLLKMNVGNTKKVVSVLKYDGTPYSPAELYARCKEVL